MFTSNVKKKRLKNYKIEWYNHETFTGKAKRNLYTTVKEKQLGWQSKQDTIDKLCHTLYS